MAASLRPLVQSYEDMFPEVKFSEHVIAAAEKLLCDVDLKSRTSIAQVPQPMINIDWGACAISMMQDGSAAFMDADSAVRHAPWDDVFHAHVVESVRRVT